MKQSFFLVYLSLATIIIIDPIDAFLCPTPDGFYRDPDDAHKYFECVNGHDYHFTCPADLVFNESIQACDYTTGPVVTHPTQGPVTVPTGYRTRHTTGSAGPTEPPASTEPVETRGTHVPHTHETIETVPVTTATESDHETTRGRHH